jgi:glutathione synthase/RimK-type ligase-like ATP-grasp enzyme
MILLCGIPSETPLAMVREALEEAGRPYLLFNQRRFAEMSFNYELAAGRLAGTFALDGQSYDLSGITGVYTRLMDDQRLPEVRDLPPHADARTRCRRLHDALLRWTEITPARVVNRYGPMGSNGSKPYQAQLIARHGFKVPETLVTNDPALAEDFYRQHQRVIYKSISGSRSIVKEMVADDLARLAQIRWCPTQFQAYVPGVNVRVHIVGRELFATKIESDITDYRYAHTLGGESVLTPVDLDEEWAERCLGLTESLGLAFSGIDLKITPDEEVYCFEVNPSPGFSYYEQNTGQPIARAVANYLSGPTRARATA